LLWYLIFNQAGGTDMIHCLANRLIKNKSSQFNIFNTLYYLRFIPYF